MKHLQDGNNSTLVPFANHSCCDYEDPKRLMNHTEKFIILAFSFAQNPRYFEDIIEEIREILKFSPHIVSEGKRLVGQNGSRPPGEFSFWSHAQRSALCVHSRRADFLERNISTDMMATVAAANVIARKEAVNYHKSPRILENPPNFQHPHLTTL
ncbi:hypothetical protein COOONC_02439 [Cooperia oncophora]